VKNVRGGSQKQQEMETTTVTQPTEPVVADAANKKSDQENYYDNLTKTIGDAHALVKSFSSRLFKVNANYKKLQQLPAEAPGKKQLIMFAAKVAALQKHTDKLYGSHNRKKREPSVDHKTGFNRMILASPAVTEIMKLGDWGMLSEVKADRGVVTHRIVTRFVSNYIDLNCLKNPNEPSRWSANPAVERLFENEWEKKGINRASIKYTDIQKLLVPHMDKVIEGSHEQRKEAFYREKCDDAGELGGATKKIFDLRKRLETLGDQVEKQNEVLSWCRTHRPGQGVTAEVETGLRTAVVEYRKVGAELRASADAFGFTYSKDFPHTPKLCVEIL
jgi:hypothetical protein